MAEASEVESAAVSAIKSDTGQDAQVDCGSDALKLEAGQSIECSVRVGDDGVDRSALVRVASVTDDGYAVDVALDPALVSEPAAVAAGEVKTLVANELKSVTHADPSVTCEHELARVVGTNTTCQAKFVGEDQPRPGQVRVSSVDGSGVPEVDVALVPSVDERQSVSYTHLTLPTKRIV